MPPEVRPLVPSDAPACADIFYSAFNTLHERHHIETEDPNDRRWLLDAVTHLSTTDPATSLLAADEQSGEPIAFAQAYRRDRFWFLSFLFVRPGAQSAGLGRSLLERVLPPEPERPSFRMDTVVESFQPVSTGLYASYGIAPRMPRYGLSGLKDPGMLPLPAGGLKAEPLDDASIDELADLDRALIGYARPTDHAYFLGQATQAYVYRHREGLAGYAYLDAEPYIGPVAAADEDTALAIIRDLLERLDDPSKGSVAVSGRSGRILRGLLRAGMRMGDASYPFVYCSTSPSPMAPSYLPYTGFLP